MFAAPPDSASLRPRELLRVRGAQALADVELIALVLGTRELTAAARVLERVGGTGGLAGAALDELRDVLGVGEARACALSAAVELGRRTVGGAPAPGRPFTEAAAVHAAYVGRLGDAQQEEFLALLLDARLRLRREVLVARGGVTACQVSPREAFAEAVRTQAAAVLFVHNHPSGDPTPSPDDAALAAHLDRVGALLGIRVVDHVIVARDGFHSRAADRARDGGLS